MTTVKADDRRRVQIPGIEPGQVFAYEAEDGMIKLTPVKKVEPEAPKCRIVKEDGFTVVVPKQPINEKAIEELLANFP